MAHQVEYSEPLLPYPLRTVQTAQGPAKVYDIPEQKKGAVLEKLYPFIPLPSLVDEMEDIHAEKTFRVKDFMVVREGQMNFLVSPYYFESGGSVIDWVSVGEDEENDCDETVST
jgi:hypothetical protein